MAKWTKYECTLCGYIYDPRKGDPDNDVPKNTPFSDVPDEWECPECGASKDDFEPIDEDDEE
jgi:rubredoxin